MGPRRLGRGKVRGMGPLFCPKQRFNGAEIFNPGRAWAVKPTIKILARRVNTLVVWGKIKRNHFAGDLRL